MQKLNNETAPVSSITIIDRGDLFASGMNTLVNPINCKGAMGKGLALAFKKQYPLMFKDYQQRCNNGLVILGQPYLWKETPSSPISILNFPTKDHWKNASSLSDIRSGLDYLARHAKEWGITSLAIPALGCGLGGLPWELVLPEIKTYLAPLNIPILVYKDGPVLEKTVARKRTKTVQRAMTTDQPSNVLESFFTKKRKGNSPPTTQTLSEEKTETASSSNSPV